MPRLFVAIEPPDGLRRALSRLGADLAGARPTPPQGLHLTLRFIGEVDQATAERLSGALAAIDRPRLELTPRGIGCFPNPRRATVAWAGLENSQPLTDLQAAVEAALQACDVPPERRPFHPHFTVARFRRPDPRATGAWLAAHADFVAPAFRVDEFSLWSSELRPEGALHRCLADFSLAGG